MSREISAQFTNHNLRKNESNEGASRKSVFRLRTRDTFPGKNLI